MAINKISEWFQKAANMFKKPNIEAHETKEILNNLDNKRIINICKRFSKTQKNILKQWLQDYVSNKENITDDELSQINNFLKQINIDQIQKPMEKEVKVETNTENTTNLQVGTGTETEVEIAEEEQTKEESIKDLLENMDIDKIRNPLIRTYKEKYENKWDQYVEEDIFLARINTFWLKYLAIINVAEKIDKNISNDKLSVIKKYIESFKDPAFYANKTTFFKKLFDWVKWLESNLWITLDMVDDFDQGQSLDDQAVYLSSLDIKDTDFPQYMA